MYFVDSVNMDLFTVQSILHIFEKKIHQIHSIFSSSIKDKLSWKKSESKIPSLANLF